MHQDKSKWHRIPISGYTHDGAGVGRLDGQVVFVPQALENESVWVSIKEKRKGILWGELHEIESPHPARIDPICEVYGQCGGCQLQHVAYQEQLDIKRNLVKAALKRLGRLEDVTVHPVLGMSHPWGYRNKGHFRVGLQGQRVVLGFCEEGSHQLVPQSCRYLFPPHMTTLLSGLAELLTCQGIQVSQLGQAGLRHVLIRESYWTGELLIVFITDEAYKESFQTIAREICLNHPDIVGVCQSYHAGRGFSVLGEPTTVLRGRDCLRDKIGSLVFEISVPSFFQVNTQQAGVLYDKVLEYAALHGEETVVDAYCGTGSMTLFLAQKAKRVIGLEIVAAAIADAKKNAVINDVQNVEFIEGLAERLLPRLVQEGLSPDVVVVDPPRKGCDHSLLECILKVQPGRVVYVSCNPATLARDLRILVDGGYRVVEVQPVDMFPQTSHVEAIIIMTNCGSSDKK